MFKKSFCQSCGMPMSKDLKKGGSDADGSKSEKYCSYCYQNGNFTSNIANVKEYQKYIIGVMKENGTNGILAWILTRGIPRLERWKK